MRYCEVSWQRVVSICAPTAESGLASSFWPFHLWHMSLFVNKHETKLSVLILYLSVIQVGGWGGGWGGSYLCNKLYDLPYSIGQKNLSIN